MAKLPLNWKIAAPLVSGGVAFGLMSLTWGRLQSRAISAAATDGVGAATEPKVSVVPSPRPGTRAAVEMGMRSMTPEQLAAKVESLIRSIDERGWDQFDEEVLGEAVLAVRLLSERDPMRAVAVVSAFPPAARSVIGRGSICREVFLTVGRTNAPAALSALARVNGGYHVTAVAALHEAFGGDDALQSALRDQMLPAERYEVETLPLRNRAKEPGRGAEAFVAAERMPGLGPLGAAMARHAVLADWMAGQPEEFENWLDSGGSRALSPAQARALSGELHRVIAPSSDPARQKVGIERHNRLNEKLREVAK